MEWVCLSAHFPSFFSYRIPDYSSQYALSVPLPSPSSIKLGIVATAIRITGNVREGERVFYAIRDAEIRISPPKQIAINSVFIKRFKKRGIKTKEDKEKYEQGLLPSFESTFGVREYVFFPDDIKLFIGGKIDNSLTGYFNALRYVGSGDSIVYVRSVEHVEKPPENAIRAIPSDEFTKAVASSDHFIVYPVKDISKSAKFEQVNPYLSKSGKNILETRYYLIKAKIRKGKNWKILEVK